ncbi:hypothetical protein EXIGLDRAFT_777154 [Exidia glandulosa HHB12029]|uniref:F-box domain-containing protein n=1 Tax=Exidia glandulosa HHB12029 TaxID=1314781 RepID=A0A165D624_EXIGL|nr:hypothetical protein EXIGLDRAFT_777154 [Exidia glandulosa HHB12029]
MPDLNPKPGGAHVPYDVLEHVAEFADQASLAALCRVSHEVSSLASPRLYHDLSAHFGANRAARAVAFLELVARDQSRGARVLSLSIEGELPHNALRTFVVALRLMPMLRHLYCRNLEDVLRLDVTCLDALRSLTRLESFALFTPYETSSAPTRILDAIRPLKRLHIDRNDTSTAAYFPPLQRLLLRSSDTLVSLSIVNSKFDLAIFLTETGSGVIWPNLTYLTVHDISSRFPAQSFPNLEQLHICDTNDRTIDPVEQALCNTSPVLFPKLTRLSTVAVGGKLNVVEKRNIRHLAATVSQHRFGFNLLMPLFSLPALRSLQWAWSLWSSASVLQPLPEILQQCTNLRYLGIDTREDPHECVSAVVDALNSVRRKELLPLLHYVSVRTANAAQASKKLDTLQSMITPLFVGFAGLRCFQLCMAEGVEVWRRLDSTSDGNGPDEPIIARDANFRLSMTFDEVVAHVELECTEQSLSSPAFVPLP